MVKHKKIKILKENRPELEITLNLKYFSIEGIKELLSTVYQIIKITIQKGIIKYNKQYIVIIPKINIKIVKSVKND